MKTLITAMAIAAAIAAPSVSGTWTMQVSGGPHGNATMEMTLEQKGTAVTGTFVSGHAPDMALKGEFVDGALKAETEGDPDSKVVFTAKLKDDGTLAGYISSPVGDMTWTAKRR